MHCDSDPTVREVLPCQSSSGLLLQPLYECWVRGMKAEWDFCAPVEWNRGSKVVP